MGPRTYAIEDPSSTHVRRIYQNHHVHYIPVPVDESGVRTDLLAESNADIVHVTPAQHFPLGFSMPVQRRLELLEWVHQGQGRYIIEDDYNSEFRYHGNQIPPISSIDITDKVIYLNTFSKTIAPSLRLSYMILPRELMDRYVETMSFYSSTVSNLQQLTTAHYLEAGYFDRYNNRMKKYFVSQRKMMMRTVREQLPADRFRLRFFPAGTHMLLEIQTDMPDTELLGKLKEAGILASFVSQYCEIPDPRYDHLMILNYSTITEAKLIRFLTVLRKLVLDA